MLRNMLPLSPNHSVFMPALATHYPVTRALLSKISLNTNTCPGAQTRGACLWIMLESVTV